MPGPVLSRVWEYQYSSLLYPPGSASAAATSGFSAQGVEGIYSGSSRGSFLLRSLPLSLTSLPSEMSSEPVDPSTLDLDDNNLNKITKPL